MVEMSDEMSNYINDIQRKVDECYDIARLARQKGFDPEFYVESPQAKDLAGRVEKLVGPEGVAEVIRALKAGGKSEDEIVFQVVSDILDKKIGNIDTMDDRVDRAIRVGLAIKTMGVVSAPLEGISNIQIRQDQQGHKYLSLYFAGPIRAAGGTTAGLCVLIADFVRRKSNIPKYKATEGEIGRYVEEVKLYDRRVHLQYPSSNDEIRFAVDHLPVEINGDSTENEEVSAFRDLPRVETNSIRGGACLVLNDGILLKAPKLLKIAKAMDLKDWDWLADLKKIAYKDSSKEKEKNEKIKENVQKIKPNAKYVADIIAGRPVFSHPSRIGGHRIRYGRSRNTGLAAGGMHPAAMVLLDKFVAIGTQLRIERPGKSTSICPVTSLEPPIVKMKNGDVIRVSTMKKADTLFPDVKKILFLGDISFGFGEFAENNHKLIPSGYVEEWWALDLQKIVEKEGIKDKKIKNYITNPFENIPTAEEAIQFSKELGIPLHPAYTDFWGNITISELKKLKITFEEAFNPTDKSIKLTYEKGIKKILEKAFIIHRVKENHIYFSKAMIMIYKNIFNLGKETPADSREISTVFDYFYTLSSIKIKNKAPYFMGTRMGRPEKSERKSMRGIHTLFPLSDRVGNTRLVQKAYDLGKIKIDVCRKKCPDCGTLTLFNKCQKCGAHTKLKSICSNCKKLFDHNEVVCPQCNSRLNYSEEAAFNIRNHIKKSLKAMNLPLPKKFKGIFGLTNKFKIPEPIEKGILRAKNKVLVYKTAEIRYDATDIPLTHFKPSEIGVSIQSLRELGYREDFKGNPITNENQIIELKVQDILLSEDCANYFVKVANFLDDELDYFYKMERFYHVDRKEDLIGHLVVGLAPHTSAGIIGRIIGFSPARSIYAHPFWHASKRRNADGDEDGIMLLLDPLLNFSRYYLPSKIGGRMDATLVIGTLLDPNEIDSEAHNIDTLERYPIEFYKATERYARPSEIEDLMNLVKRRLGSSNQYENIEFNLPTEDINAGPKTTAYKLHESMDDKIEAQLHLAKIIKAVDAKNVAKKILSTHFNPDILGNLRKFALQEFRCVKCNTKYRRPPLSNGRKCPKCNNNIILTVNRGGIEKYIPRALKLCEDFKLDEYTNQRMELIQEYVISLANNPKIKQQKLSDFF
ncbi:MAG: DNA polymerase II large subunit [Candidatus Lokiarchaeota archaeon]|nr:DNA polymerase II large subunit [Candidatus Lokiarchaeota archaeon]MBD3201864.1 DNA polymerase II large subunit [Candidatus Lokiarchaeota archaeon]